MKIQKNNYFCTVLLSTFGTGCKIATFGGILPHLWQHCPPANKQTKKNLKKKKENMTAEFS